MTFILTFDLDMFKMYLHAKIEVSMSSGSKVIAWTDRNTDTQTDMTENITYPHTRVVKMDTRLQRVSLYLFINCKQDPM